MQEPCQDKVKLLPDEELEKAPGRMPGENPKDWRADFLK
jgi:hypothetical protein